SVLPGTFNALFVALLVGKGGNTGLGPNEKDACNTAAWIRGVTTPASIKTTNTRRATLQCLMRILLSFLTCAAFLSSHSEPSRLLKNALQPPPHGRGSVTA